MLELHAATIRCQCGYSIRHSGAMVNRAPCPRCGNRPPQDELSKFDQHLAVITDPALCDHDGQSSMQITPGISMCCGCSRLMNPPESVKQKCVAGTILVRRVFSPHWISAYLSAEDRASIWIGQMSVPMPWPRRLVKDWPTALRVLLTWDGHGEPEGWNRMEKCT